MEYRKLTDSEREIIRRCRMKAEGKAAHQGAVAASDYLWGEAFAYGEAGWLRVRDALEAQAERWEEL